MVCVYNGNDCRSVDIACSDKYFQDGDLLMNLYKLEEKENAPENNIGVYDSFESFVIRAETDKRARKLAYDDSGMEEWKNPEISTCIPLKIEGKEEIIIGSYISG